MEKNKVSNCCNAEIDYGLGKIGKPIRCSQCRLICEEKEIKHIKTLNEKLIEHYDCFNRERFFLDEHNEKEGFLSIVSSSINDTCPINLCRGIAKFCKKHIEHKNYQFIYVGAWAFKVSAL